MFEYFRSAYIQAVLILRVFREDVVFEAQSTVLTETLFPRKSVLGPGTS